MAGSREAWWQDYFSPLYREVYEGPLSNSRQTRREAAFLEEALGPIKPGPVLDVGCGFGRHVRALRHRGFKVVGTDRFVHLLERHAPGARRAVCADMRRLPFAARSFQGAYCIFNTFGYFADSENRQVLAECARVLAPGGRFVLQIPNGPIMAGIAHEFTPSQTAGPKLTMTEQYAFDPDKKTLQGSGVWRIGDQEQAWTLELQLYTHEEIAAALESCGLQVVEILGDYDGEEFDPGESAEIVLVAERVGD